MGAPSFIGYSFLDIIGLQPSSDRYVRANAQRFNVRAMLVPLEPWDV